MIHVVATNHGVPVVECLAEIAVFRMELVCVPKINLWAVSSLVEPICMVGSIPTLSTTFYLTINSNPIYFIYMKYNPADFQRGQAVHVIVDDADVLTDNFDGHIVGIRHIGNEFFVQVTPNGDYDNHWDFYPNQLTFISK